MSDSESGYFRAGIVRGQLVELEQSTILAQFSGFITDVVAKINDGKEATVYLCNTASGEHLAAKMYRARRFRAFRNDRQYSAPLRHRGRDKRMDKAMQKATDKGREFGQWQWVEREWLTLEALHAAGASVPRPVARCEAGILMEFIGDDQGAAPRLHDVLAHRRGTISTDLLASWWNALLDDVVLMLRADMVHGDLSAYNVLVQDEQPRVIDVPQAADARADAAFDLLQRDLLNLSRPFQQAGLDGVHDDAVHLAQSLWRQYRSGRL